MSPIVHTIVTTVGGILAGLALAGALLWRQHQALLAARHDATHDELTGLPNRRLLLTRLRAALNHHGCFGLVLLDLDRFKTVNDTFGHDTGNLLLAQVGRLLEGLDAPIEIAARLSGDEFALLVRGDRDDVAAAAHAAWSSIGGAPLHLDNDGTTIDVATSVGFTLLRLGMSPRQVLAEADQAMYKAKRLGLGVWGHSPLTEPSGYGRSRDRHHH
ncbi:GGDEF domain-containing protein [Micromonospora palomenae]|uniref:GGDEF domain-containing protein n=1 Tax=Micromonospora palomenae TaxID=1461247 RepID=UPI003F8B93CE